MAADTGRINIVQQGKAAARALANAFAQCDAWVKNVNSAGGTFQANLSQDDLNAISSTTSLTPASVLAFLALVTDVQAVRACATAAALTAALTQLTTDTAALFTANTTNSTSFQVDSIINTIMNG